MDTTDTDAGATKNKGGRPPNPPSEEQIAKVINSDAGKALVSEMVERAVEKIIGTMQRVRAEDGAPQGGTEADDKNMEFARKLAFSIAEINTQGSKRKIVPPEVMAARADAAEKMIARVAIAKARSERPEYRIVSKTYLEETFIEPFRLNPSSKKMEPVEIYWSGIPNESMRPLNDAAREIFTLYMEAIGGFTQTLNAADNRPMGMTSNGLVIKGVTNPRRTLGNLADSNNGSAFDLGFKTQFDPTAKEVNVLGTVAAPARQNYQGQVERTA